MPRQVEMVLLKPSARFFGRAVKTSKWLQAIEQSHSGSHPVSAMVSAGPQTTAERTVCSMFMQQSSHVCAPPWALQSMLQEPHDAAAPQVHREWQATSRTGSLIYAQMSSLYSASHLWL